MLAAPDLRRAADFSAGDFNALARTAGFDFSAHVRRVCEDMCRRLAELSHIDMDRVSVAFRQTRKAVPHGLQASLTPLRFENGSLTSRRRGRQWTIQRLFDAAGREFLYVLNFYLPRFLNHTLQEKLTTIVHELWHISPEFNGDLRRHEGRCYMHSHSQKQFDAWSDHLGTKWLSQQPDEELYGFLRCDFKELIARHGRIYGTRVSTPKLLPVAARE